MTYVYTTAGLIESELRASAVFSESTSPTLADVTTWIEQESNQINTDSARVWGQTTYTDVINYYGEDIIQVKNAPVISVTSVKYSEGSLGTDEYSLTTVMTEDTHYTVDKEKGTITILTRNWSPKYGLKRISIEYSAGYATTPITIQKLATKMVALRVLNTLIQSNVSEGNDGGSISVGSISIVEPASYGVNSYNQLSKDITTLKGELTTGFGVHRYINY